MRDKESLKIGLLIPELLKEGGGERQCLYLARELVKRGHKVNVYTTEYKPEDCFPDICRNLRIQVTGRSYLSRTNLPLYSRVKEYFDMKKMAAGIGEKFDILNPHAWPTHWAAANKKNNSRAIVWMCNDFMIPKVVKTAKLNYGARIKGDFANLRRSLLFAYDRSTVNNLDRVVVLDHRIQQLAGTAYNTRPVLVRSGVDVDKFKQNGGKKADLIRSRFKIKNSTFLLLSVSILLPHRRLEDIIIALRDLQASGYDIKLLHVGSLTYDSVYSQKIISLVKKTRLQEQVIFAGSIPEKELPAFYGAGDAFVFPNQEQTWGLAVTEAMAAQKPVIVSTGAGVHEILTDEKTALLVPPKRPDIISRQIIKLIRKPKFAATIAHNGYKLVSEQLSWNKYAERMLNVFRQSLNKE